MNDRSMSSGKARALREQIYVASKKYKYNFMVNDRRTFRGKLAYLIRLLAQKIDGAHSLGVKFDTQPRIDTQSEIEVINIGLKAMESALNIEVRDQSVEESMQENFAYLYKE